MLKSLQAAVFLACRGGSEVSGLRVLSGGRICPRDAVLGLPVSGARWLSTVHSPDSAAALAAEGAALRSKADAGAFQKPKVMTFGKHKGLELEALPLDYCQWMENNGVLLNKRALRSELVRLGKIKTDTPFEYPEHLVVPDYGNAPSHGCGLVSREGLDCAAAMDRGACALLLRGETLPHSLPSFFPPPLPPGFRAD